MGDGTRRTWNGHKVYFSALAGRYTNIEEKCIAHDGCSILFIYLLFFFFLRCPNGNKPCRESPLYTHHRKKDGLDRDTVKSVGPPPFFFCCLVCPTKAHCVCTHTKTICIYTIMLYKSNGFGSVPLQRVF